MISAQHLTEKHSERDQRRIDPVFPNDTTVHQCLPDTRLRQHIRKRQLFVLKKLTTKKTNL